MSVDSLPNLLSELDVIYPGTQESFDAMVAAEAPSKRSTSNIEKRCLYDGAGEVQDMSFGVRYVESIPVSKSDVNSTTVVDMLICICMCMCVLTVLTMKRQRVS